MIPFIIINGFVGIYYDKMLIQEGRLSAKQDFLNTFNATKDLFNETERIYYFFLANNSVKNFLATPDMTNVNAQTAARTNDVYTLMNNYCNISSTISSIHIYSYYNNYVLSTNGGYNIENSKNESWYGYESNELSFIVPTVVSGVNTFSVCYNIFANNKFKGLMIFEINPHQLDANFSNISSRKCNLNLIDGNRKLIYTTNLESHYKPDYNLDEENLSLTKNNEYFDVTSKVSSNYLYLNIENTKLKNHTIWIILGLCIIVAFLISFVLSFYVSINSYRSLENIIVNLNNLEGEYINTYDSTNEIAYISKNILNMHNKNIALEKALVTKISELKKLQASALQMQFTPHFLFNTLNVLSMVIMNTEGVKNPASRIISLLSDLLTSALNTNKYIISIEEEIRYSKKYIEIENIKNKNNFDTIWDIDKSILNCKTVKLTLQPIIENAFKHGIKYLRDESRGYLKISVCKENERIIFRVINNGPTITKARLDELREDMEMDNLLNLEHIGLCNVNRRIKLIFGNQYGCDIDSDVQGTCVSIIIPKDLDFIE